MEVLLIAVASFFLFILAYNTYGRWLGKKIFRLSAKNKAPSVEFNDDVDFVPTNKKIVFGHHFTSIAGTGPIVGPAIAVIWGWLPALLWVVFGSIFIGAVHDFGSLIISMRNKGQTVGDIAGKVIHPRAQLLFLLILILALTIVLAIFGLVIAKVFKMYPSAIFPCFLQIPLAIGIGYYFHLKKKSLFIPSVFVLIIMYLSTYYGDIHFLNIFNNYLASQPVFTWVIGLLIYSYIASVLPVWTLLQPRDYINSLQLLGTLGLVILGLILTAFIGGAPLISDSETIRPVLKISAPLINKSSLLDAPAIFPFLFITIACGAISGFHCLVSSGTSSKQLNNEESAQFIGYGAMLTEGFLAVIVILSCVAGIGLGLSNIDGELLFGKDAYFYKYNSWKSAGALDAKISAFVTGSSNFLKTLGISSKFSIALMGVFVASFAATTLDTACRLQRYVVQELFIFFSNTKKNLNVNTKKKKNFVLSLLKNKHGATIFAIIIAASLAALPHNNESLKNWSWSTAGTGGLILWQMFGATNQLLGGLAFIVITFWLLKQNSKVYFILLPMTFMLVVPAWSLIYNLFVSDTNWIFSKIKNYPLIIIALATLILEFWLILEAITAFYKLKIKSKKN